MKIQIRETHDVELWRATDQLIFDREPWEPYDCEFYWLAYADGHIAGHCSMALLKENDGVGYLTRAGVLDKYRGLGIHRRMLNVRKRCAKKLNLRALITYAAADNVYSINNLWAAGFRAYHPENNWIDDPRGEFIYFILHL